MYYSEIFYGALKNCMEQNFKFWERSDFISSIFTAFLIYDFSLKFCRDRNRKKIQDVGSSWCVSIHYPLKRIVDVRIKLRTILDYLAGNLLCSTNAPTHYFWQIKIFFYGSHYISFMTLLKVLSQQKCVCTSVQNEGLSECL